MPGRPHPGFKCHLDCTYPRDVVNSSSIRSTRRVGMFHYLILSIVTHISLCSSCRLFCTQLAQPASAFRLHLYWDNRASRQGAHCRQSATPLMASKWNLWGIVALVEELKIRVRSCDTTLWWEVTQCTNHWNLRQSKCDHKLGKIESVLSLYHAKMTWHDVDLRHCLQNIYSPSLSPLLLPLHLGTPTVTQSISVVPGFLYNLPATLPCWVVEVVRNGFSCHTAECNSQHAWPKVPNSHNDFLELHRQTCMFMAYWYISYLARLQPPSDSLRSLDCILQALLELLRSTSCGRSRYSVCRQIAT